MGPVRRRRVIYIPGFDPFPARRYRELYRSESAKQGAISGYQLEQHSGTATGWHVRGLGADVQVDVLTWSDIVQQSMRGLVLATYGQLVRTAWIYLSTGALWRLAQLRKGPVLAALYPVAMLLGQALVAFAVARLATFWLGWVATFMLMYGLLHLFKAKDGPFKAHYLMHDYAFAASEKGAYPEALAKRLEEFTLAIQEAREDGDEVLIVGHSSGAYLAVSILADALRERMPRAGDPEVALLTLGHVVPMVSFLPNANRLRRDLAELSARDDITWVDVSAPGDGCAFALCDPVAVSGVAPESKRWPLVFSAAFTQSLRPETWKALRWRFFRLHFQYLCAFDAPKDYDYFQITAGTKTLRDRYGDRVPSKSRIVKPLSPHRSTS